MMKCLPKVSGLVSVALACLVIASASPTPEQMIASGSIDEVIRTLSTRSDAASVNLLSRAYYAIEQWDNAVKNGDITQAQENAILTKLKADVTDFVNGVHGPKAATTTTKTINKTLIKYTVHKNTVRR